MSSRSWSPAPVIVGIAAVLVVTEAAAVAAVPMRRAGGAGDPCLAAEGVATDDACRQVTT